MNYTEKHIKLTILTDGLGFASGRKETGNFTLPTSRGLRQGRER